ncbi:MAG: hypothetical protein ACTSSF_12330, partial [Candidatus Heimdallarchaeaceae archaeon]
MVTKFPVFVLCGRDAKKRELIEKLDPKDEYKVKPLLPFLGKRIIDWQIQELYKSPYTEEIYLLGISKEMATFDIPVHYVPVPTISTHAEKLLAGLRYIKEQNKDYKMFIVSSSDTPGISVEPINEFCEFVEKNMDCDYIQSVVPEDITKEKFPDHKRVVGKFKDVNVYPGELYALSEKGIITGQKIIEEIGGGRRKIKKNARTKKTSALVPIMKLVLTKPRSWLYIFLYLIGQLKLKGAEKLLSIIANGKVKAVIIK